MVSLLQDPNARRGPVPAAAKDPASIPYTPEWYARQNAAWTARVDQSARVPTIVTAPAKKATTTTKKTYAVPASASAPAPTAPSAPAPTFNDGYNKAVAEANARKSNDAPQIAALQAMLDSGFGQARDTKLGNIATLLGQQDKTMLEDYTKRSGALLGSSLDNDKSEADASFANLANRARERGDILSQASAQGAGESDTLLTTLAALRNWSANQADVNRSFFDTQRSVGSAITDLNSDTRTARSNLYGASLSDQEQVWSNYYNQRADAYTQMGNIQASTTSDSYKADSDSYAKAAAEAGTSWKSPGIPAAIADWKGDVQPSEQKLNNTDASAAVTNLGTRKKPEGATLRKW